ncbi:hypothetical protein NM688_g8207 [Phlebia brevispora]|uniref:Uncharacterized protein n=1 Tax=Phlebia brevispora TaxID=194682 RepID=A0ACC1RW54_9APHY|nr:hypothetical protein NM688_g8207 [Phlebia brevispora]
MSADASATKPSLAMFPQEVLEHIVFFAATDNFLGPPAGLLPFLTLNHALHEMLSFETNPHLYARIFSYKYDLASAVRRMGADNLPATALAEELRRRSIILRQFRNLVECKAGRTQFLDTMLWTAYLMVLESDGKNELQLREYAQINTWLKAYWFHPSGTSGALRIVSDADQWPDNTQQMSLALWLLWFMLNPGTSLDFEPCLHRLTRLLVSEEYAQDKDLFRNATGVLKVIALGAHRVSQSPSRSTSVR